MSPFKLEISNHAAERLRQRRITRRDLRQCLARGETISVDIRGRKIRALKFGARTLEVVLLETAGGFLVVTAYWRK